MGTLTDAVGRSGAEEQLSFTQQVLLSLAAVMVGAAMTNQFLLVDMLRR